MIKYLGLGAIISVAIVYTLLTNILLRRNILVTESIDKDDEDTNDVPDKVLVYKEQSGEITFKNFDDDLLKYIIDVKNEEEKLIPRHGIYKFTVSQIEEKKHIMGIPN